MKAIPRGDWPARLPPVIFVARDLYYYIYIYELHLIEPITLETLCAWYRFIQDTMEEVIPNAAIKAVAKRS